MPISQPGQAGGAAEFDFEGYEYMGKKASGGYEYFGYKKYGGTDWKVMRKDTTDESAWQYAYGSSGWTAAWADPTALTYSDPPDA